MQQTIILCPLYNDEASFNIFATAVNEEVKHIENHQFSFLVVDDATGNIQLTSQLPLTIIHLQRNLGHQKAISIGLSYAHHHLTFDQIIIMDCDGEDQPKDIRSLISASPERDKIIVAKRASRQEGQGFRIFYLAYKFLFRLLTGKQISFGNFMLLPKKDVNKIVHYSEIWNHLAGAIVKSKIPFRIINTHRGKRYEGSSNMNFTSLLLHGLGAIGVFIDIIASRLLIFSLVMILVSLLAIAVIISIKLFTDKAIPGWATTAVSSMLIVLLQSFLLSLFTIFLYLSFQGQRRFIPALHYMDYVQSVETSNNG